MYIFMYIFVIGLIASITVSKGLHILLILTIPFLYLLFVRIYRTFFVKIAFTDDHLIYKSLLGRIEINYQNAGDILSLTKRYLRATPPFFGYWQNLYFNYNFEKFENMDEIYEFPFGTTFTLIGNVDDYSLNPYFTLMSPVHRNYVTIQYREELSDLLHYIIKKRDEFSKN